MHNNTSSIRLNTLLRIVNICVSQESHQFSEGFRLGSHASFHMSSVKGVKEAFLGPGKGKPGAVARKRMGAGRPKVCCRFCIFCISFWWKFQQLVDGYCMNEIFLSTII